MNDEPHNETTASSNKFGITRRECVSALGVAGSTLAQALPVIESATAAETAPPTVSIELHVNRQSRKMAIDPRTTLLDLLREHLDLTGTKKGCDHGQCGACTVLANGRRINSCLSLAASHDGDEITTIEGLAYGGTLHPVQSAFIDHDGFQCGYCTPGQICSTVALLAEAKRGDASFVTRDFTHSGPANLSDDEIRERMSGNICRCGAYPGIVAAVKTAAGIPSESAESKEGQR